ncbi:FecCD family ABC transporter permease [Klugiella xanthotipulae]|uniref:Iron complex transport system permease protein n=1 Tax=Klugiella xanthotipulae TaxID=244735 RepID=A0A543HHC0_9MICO|nr:iron chelate uptake ABC transporter family permease subunit [Klugiella xanthotipulae]TQM57721.1 iron complex transport system permease protein [Klugiella xanthotipulae]
MTVNVPPCVVPPCAEPSQRCAPRCAPAPGTRRAPYPNRAPAPPQPPPRRRSRPRAHRRAHRRTRRRAGLLLAVTALVLLVAALSLLVGSNPIPPGTVWHLLGHPDGGLLSTVIHGQRVPRALLALAVGAALGVAGALMQSLTRNPLAEPGVLGINAGASLAVVLAVAITGVSSIWFSLWCAFFGAAAASVAVYVLGSVGRRGATPVRLALAGVALSMAISSIVQTIILANQNVFNEFRFWAAGSMEGRGFPVLCAVVVFILVGLGLAVALAPALNALALGEETARALGVRVGLTRGLVMLAVTLLAGAATAAVGPLSFVGLGVPYAARALCGPDQRWVLPFSLVLGPVFLLVADLLARVVVAPQEVQVGIITAVMGGPLLVMIVRRRRIESL